MHNLYVYYRVQAEQVPAVESAVVRLFSEIQAHTGIVGALFVRSAQAAPATWMEVFENITDLRTFENALRAAEALQGIHALLTPEARKYEVFQRLSINSR